MVEVTAWHFDREGRWTKTVSMKRPIYFAHVDSKDYYKGLWEKRNRPMKRGEILVVLNVTSERPLPVLIRASGETD